MKRTVILLLCAASGYLTPLSAQEIPNGDFSKGTEGWILTVKDTAKALQEVVPDANEGKPALKVTVSEAPENSWWMVNVHSAPAIKLEAGATYTIAFKARCEVGARSVAVKLGGNGKLIGREQKFKLTEDWQEFLYSFLVEDATDTAALVLDNLSVNQAVYYFSDFRITKE